MEFSIELVGTCLVAGWVIYSAYKSGHKAGVEAADRISHERIALAIMFHQTSKGLTPLERADSLQTITLGDIEAAPKKLATLPPDAALKIRNNVDEYIRLALHQRTPF